MTGLSTAIKEIEQVARKATMRFGHVTPSRAHFASVISFALLQNLERKQRITRADNQVLAAIQHIR